MSLRTVAAMMLGLLACGCGGLNEARIRDAVARQMHDYPCSTLCDIYKSFFQERFGPGHIVTDRAAAANFIQREIEQANGNYGCGDYEPAGCGDNFWRVSLEVIADGRVPFDTYLDAFMRSVNDVEQIDVEVWRKDWQQILSIVTEMKLDLPDFGADSTAIMRMLASGRYAWHHSRVYNEHYHPHYRLIRRDIFESELRPLIDGTKQ